MTEYQKELYAFEKQLLSKYYYLYNRNELKASKAMGINRTTLHDKLIYYGLRKGYLWKQRKRHEPSVRFYTKRVFKRGKRAKEEIKDASAFTEIVV